MRNMSPRWIGIRISAVITILGSAATLLLAASMLFFVIVSPPLPETSAPPVPVKAITIAMANLNLFLSAWGIATAVGIFRRRPWSRISILVFAAILAFFGTVSPLILLAMPVPETPGVDPDKMAMIFRFVGAFYLALGALGIWWLILFNRKITKSYFARSVEVPEDPRPLSIRIIAWYLLVGVAILVPMSILRLPTLMFGIVFSGWGVLTVYVPIIVIQAYVGVGLLRLRESARIVGIGYFVLIAVNGFVSLNSQRQQEFLDRLRSSYRWMDQPGQSSYQPEFSWPFLLIMLALAALPVYFLIRRRAAFHPSPAELPHNEDGVETPGPSRLGVGTEVPIEERNLPGEED